MRNDSKQQHSVVPRVRMCYTLGHDKKKGGSVKITLIRTVKSKNFSNSDHTECTALTKLFSSL